MPIPIELDRVKADVLEILDETFGQHHGIFLDEGTSLFQTLEAYDAITASIPVGGKCASIAAQVAHVTFYLQVLERYILTGASEDEDWGEIWRTVREVTPAKWAALRQELQQTYGRLLAELEDDATWNRENAFPGALAILAHTAYHLGEIRQALCVLK